MIGKNKERWQQLCELAEKEQDPDKLIALITEINRLLEAKQLINQKNNSQLQLPLK